MPCSLSRGWKTGSPLPALLRIPTLPGLLKRHLHPHLQLPPPSVTAPALSSRRSSQPSYDDDKKVLSHLTVRYLFNIYLPAQTPIPATSFFFTKIYERLSTVLGPLGAHRQTHQMNELFIRNKCEINVCFCLHQTCPEKHRPQDHTISRCLGIQPKSPRLLPTARMITR